MSKCETRLPRNTDSTCSPGIVWSCDLHGTRWETPLKSAALHQLQSIKCKLLKQTLMWELLLFSWIRSRVESSRVIQNSRVGHDQWCYYRIYKRVIKNYSCSGVSVGVKCGAEGCSGWNRVELLDFTALSDRLCLALLDVQNNLVSISDFVAALFSSGGF